MPELEGQAAARSATILVALRQEALPSGSRGSRCGKGVSAGEVVEGFVAAVGWLDIDVVTDVVLVAIGAERSPGTANMVGRDHSFRTETTSAHPLPTTLVGKSAPAFTCMVRLSVRPCVAPFTGVS